MKNYKLLFIVLTFFIVGCSDDSVEQDCIDQQLESLGMVPYTGQKISCEFFLRLYVFQNKQYFQLDSYCAGIEAKPVDCEGNEICEDNTRFCRRFNQNAIDMGIVGISQ